MQQFTVDVDNSNNARNDKPSKLTNCWNGFSNWCRNLSRREKFVIFSLLFIGVLLTCVLVPLSFWYVKYNQYAFTRDKFGVVDTDKVITQGRYFYPLTHELIFFPSTYNPVKLIDSTGTSLSIFTLDGYQIFLNVVFWYKIPKENLASIYNKYSMNYGNAVTNEAKLIIKNFAGSSSSGFNLPLVNYITERNKIESNMAATFSTRMREAIGVDVPVEYFKILNIDIPANMIAQYLQTVIQAQDNIIQQNTQNVIMIQAETETLVSRINVQSNYTITTANIDANIITTNSQSEANKIILSARGDGLEYIMNKLNITDSSNKEKLFRILAITDNANPRIFYGLNGQLIIQ